MLVRGLFQRLGSFTISTISKGTMAAVAVTVTRPPKEQAQDAPRPAHHMNNTKSLFTNPWPSFRDASFSAMGGFFYKLMMAAPKPEKDIEKILKLQTPTWGQGAQKSDLKATWTWVLTVEPIMEPPQLLAQEAKKAGLAEDAFNICGLGETVTVPSS
ncbi:hypothetical protein FS842_000451 [Serendipita sp. 407]|nr:hypothetical protein FS842_000451 [Serendipita sp. 407]